MPSFERWSGLWRNPNGFPLVAFAADRQCPLFEIDSRPPETVSTFAVVVPRAEDFRTTDTGPSNKCNQSSVSNWLGVVKVVRFDCLGRPVVDERHEGIPLVGGPELLGLGGAGVCWERCSGGVCSSGIVREKLIIDEI
jgi:hypothetical protein